MGNSDVRWEEKYAKVVLSGGHEIFFERFLLATQINSLIIISPWITTLENERVSLDDILSKIKKEKVKSTIIMRDPKKEPLNAKAFHLFSNNENINLFVNNELHAKVYICRCSPFGFALVGSANLSGKATRAYEVGVLIEGKGHGREIVEQLELLGTDDLPNRSGTIFIS